MFRHAADPSKLGSLHLSLLLVRAYLEPRARFIAHSDGITVNSPRPQPSGEFGESQPDPRTSAVFRVEQVALKRSDRLSGYGTWNEMGIAVTNESLYDHG